MQQERKPPPSSLDEDTALRRILEGTATQTGEGFFFALVQNLAEVLQTEGAWVTEYHPEPDRLRTLAFRWGGEWIANFEYEVAGTPCQIVVSERRCVHVPQDVIPLYPLDPDLRRFAAVSYMGVPLLDVDGGILGNLAVMDTRPLPPGPRLTSLFQIFAARAAAEHQRLRAEAGLREREARLTCLVESAMDAIVEIDRDWRVTLINPAAEAIFACAARDALGRDFHRFLTEESRAQLGDVFASLASRPEGRRFAWLAGGFRAVGAGGATFAAEASVSRVERQGQRYHLLILRDVNERLEAERRIHSLTAETEYLREEIRALQPFDEFVGSSEALALVLRDIQQVGDTDATVLVLGETGTGKELVARAVHASSRRRDKPLIKINCAAMPATLIESELFGHEKGAFTGATARREGRFALADGGTIFLDEIGDLPLDLQAKLLRVLQEGEFEPLGSSRTHRVDVRVIAATNHDLQTAAREGRFREDLFYRLNVFPMRLPPLRERRGDVAELAAAFADRFARRLGRRLEPLAPDDIRRLTSYDWPGNVRELQNVIERAVITAEANRLNLDRALPQSVAKLAATPADTYGPRVLTSAEMLALERDNLVLALKACDGRISGAGGAASLLGMKPSTLASRIKALGIERS